MIANSIGAFFSMNAPTKILYGEKDNLTSFETMKEFADKHKARLTVMKGGEHWFHTEEQMNFLDMWILNASRTI